ncbi:MAG: hypothetical protein AAGG57_11625 [Pseudomonadota bacterium]
MLALVAVWIVDTKRLYALFLLLIKVIACIVPFTICFALVAMGGIGVDIEQVSIAAVIISTSR